MENTITYLRTKAWYRFFKVVYITVFALIMLVVIIAGLMGELKDALYATAITIFIFFLIRGAFYYIVLGRFNPKK